MSLDLRSDKIYLDSLSKTILVTCAILSVLCIIFLSLIGVYTDNTFLLVGVGYFIGLAGFAVGYVFGFLLGIPFIAANQSASNSILEGSAKKNLVRSNSGIEQISAWLLAGITGIALANLSNFSSVFAESGNIMGSALFSGNSDKSRYLQLGTVLAQSIVVISAVTGFVCGLLQSRITITVMFNAAEKNLIGLVDEFEMELTPQIQNYITAMSLGQVPELHSKLKEKVEEIAASSVPDDPRKSVAIAEASALLAVSSGSEENFTKAEKMAQQLIDRMPAKSEIYSRAVVVRDVIRRTPYKKSLGLTINGMRTALYSKDYDNFERAIELASPYQSSPASLDKELSGQFWTLLACAYGQKHGALVTQRSSDEKAIAETKEHAIQAIRHLVETGDNVWISVVKDMISNVNHSDDDFSSLRGDSDLKNILGVI